MVSSAHFAMLIWSCHVTPDAVIVCLRDTKWHTGVYRELWPSVAMAIASSKHAFMLLADELEDELVYRTQSLRGG